jgi:hypothetical protein
MSIEDFQAFMSQVSGSPPRAGGTPSPGVPGSPGEGADPTGMLMSALDLIDRPRRAVSEAVGEAREGGSILAGLLQGISGEYEHPELGEQLIPKEPGGEVEPIEGIIKGGLRLGVDIVSDPLLFAGVGPLKTPLVKGIGKVIVGAEKLGGLAQKSPAISKLWMGLMERVLPTSTYLDYVSKVAQKTKFTTLKDGTKLLPKVSGSKVAQGMKDIYEVSRIETSLAEKGFLDVTKELGLDKRNMEPLLVEAHELIQNPAWVKGAARHPDMRVQQMAEHLRSKFDDYLKQIEGYKDLNGTAFETTHPGLRAIQRGVMKRARKYKLAGKSKEQLRDDMWQAYLNGEKEFTHEGKGAMLTYRFMKKQLDKFGFDLMPGEPSIFSGRAFHTGPFIARANYAPHMLNDDAMRKIAEGGQRFSRMVENFAEDNNMTHEEARRILQMMGGPARAGNIEYARQFKMRPEDMERNPLKYFTRYTERMYNRMAFGRVFGLDGKRLDRLLRRSVKQEGLDPKYAQGIGDIMKGRTPSDYMLNSLASKVMGFQVLTKMGPLSSLANLTQSSNTVIKDGATNFVRGILRSTTNEGQRAGVIAYQRGIHDMLVRIAGGTDALPAKYLEWIGFTPIERMNRLLGANTSLRTMEELIKKSGRWTDDIGRRGIAREELTPEIVEQVVNGGMLPQHLADRVGLLGADASQHATHYKDLPLWMQGPMARVMFQYKSFVYQQTRFLGREVLQPARKYFKSGGKEGTIMPLLRAAGVFTLGAETVNYIRQHTRAAAGKLTGLDYEVEEFDEDHPLWQLFEHSMYVGGLGAAGDLVERASRRDLKGWLLGPTFGDITDVSEGLIATLRKMSDEGPEGFPWDKLMVEAQRRVPGVGTLLPREPLKELE